MVKRDTPVQSARRSHSAETARAAEQGRVERMSPRERILLALRLGRRAEILASWTGRHGG